MGFRINVGLTLGTHNSSDEMLGRFISYFNELGVSTVRFNRFFDHGNKHPHLELSEQQIQNVYKFIKKAHGEIPMTFQINMSGDLGTSGVETMGFPENTNFCKGGTQLFVMIPTDVEIISVEQSAGKIEKVADLAACVNLFEPTLGIVVKKTINNIAEYKIMFYEKEIKKLQQLRTNKVIENGCFSRELKNMLALKQVHFIGKQNA